MDMSIIAGARLRLKTIPCGGSIALEGGDGIYTLEAELGTNTGLVVVEFDSANVPDRFQLIYDGSVVADSLFIGDFLPNNTFENEIINATSLERFVYNGTTFDADGSESVNFSALDIAVSDGSETRSNGSGTNQLGVVSDFPNSGSKASNGKIKLFFDKTDALPSKITIKITGVNNGTLWSIEELQCP
jgi:hypothetical protein